MGEAKRRGTYAERVMESMTRRQEREAMEASQQELREAAWNEKQAERRRLRLEEEEAMRAKARTTQRVVQTRRVQPGLALAAALALAGSMITLPSK